MSDSDVRQADLMSLGNLISGEVLQAMYNPEELERTVQVAYARLAPMGHSHELLQYSFRNNEKLEFILKFDRRSGVDSQKEAEATLDAMTVGSRVAQDIASGGPPDVLFLWPGVLRMRTRITTLKYTYRRFASTDGSPTWFEVKVSVEETLGRRLYAEDIRRDGLMRG